MEPKWFDTAAAATEYALSEYWVEPIQVSDEQQAWKFNVDVQPLDWSESGLVHFEKRRKDARLPRGPGRPFLSTSPTVKIEITLPASLRDKLDGMTDNRSAWVRSAIEQA